jgi:hypothetical protein
MKIEGMKTFVRHNSSRLTLSLFKEVGGGCVCVCLPVGLRVACVQCGLSRWRVWSGGAKRPLRKKGKATVNKAVHSAACTTRGRVPSGTAKHTARLRRRDWAFFPRAGLPRTHPSRRPHPSVLRLPFLCTKTSYEGWMEDGWGTVFHWVPLTNNHGY